MLKVKRHGGCAGKLLRDVCDVCAQSTCRAKEIVVAARCNADLNGVVGCFGVGDGEKNSPSEEGDMFHAQRTATVLSDTEETEEGKREHAPVARPMECARVEVRVDAGNVVHAEGLFGCGVVDEAEGVVKAFDQLRVEDAAGQLAAAVGGGPFVDCCDKVGKGSDFAVHAVEDAGGAELKLGEGKERVVSDDGAEAEEALLVGGVRESGVEAKSVGGEKRDSVKESLASADCRGTSVSLSLLSKTTCDRGRGGSKACTCLNENSCLDGRLR